MIAYHPWFVKDELWVEACFEALDELKVEDPQPLSSIALRALSTYHGVPGPMASSDPRTPLSMTSMQLSMTPMQAGELHRIVGCLHHTRAVYLRFDAAKRKKYVERLR